MKITYKIDNIVLTIPIRDDINNSCPTTLIQYCQHKNKLLWYQIQNVINIKKSPCIHIIRILASSYIDLPSLSLKQ